MHKNDTNDEKNWCDYFKYIFIFCFEYRILLTTSFDKHVSFNNESSEEQ